ncbi:hypothetical protein [Maribacter sp. 2-571]|uniref:hypothetical protein n=1 Tax=Maribacter sp. 2-571 TaxID=3417569 RepID=UPI003D34A12E
MAKKKHIDFFEEMGKSLEKTPGKNEVVSVAAGDMFKLKEPANRYYEFVHYSLNFMGHRLEMLQQLSAIRNVTVKVTSILRMKDGNHFLVLMKTDGSPFFEGVLKVFAEKEQSIKNHEIVPLSLEEKAAINIELLNNK